jgi:hypothetical protein
MLNCWNRPHAIVFERHDVFFDLDRNRHDREHQLLKLNTVCCVISYANKDQRAGRVILDFWICKGEVKHKTEKDCIGVFGDRLGATVIEKSELNEFPAFRKVLNSEGDFNQFCILVASE